MVGGGRVEGAVTVGLRWEDEGYATGQVVVTLHVR